MIRKSRLITTTTAAVTLVGGLVAVALPVSAAPGDAACVAANAALTAGQQNDATLAAQLVVAQGAAVTNAQTVLNAALNTASTGPTVVEATATLAAANAIQDPLVLVLNAAQVSLETANANVTAAQLTYTAFPIPANLTALNAAIVARASAAAAVVSAQTDLVASSRAVLQAQGVLSVAQASAAAVATAQTALDAAVANGGNDDAAVSARAALAADVPVLANLQNAVSVACATPTSAAAPVINNTITGSNATGGYADVAPVATAVHSSASYTG